MLGVGALALLLSGCGGGGGGGASSNGTAFSVPIHWAARSRDLLGPASASSVTVTLTAAGANGRDVTAFSDRGDTLATHTTFATSTGGVRPGTYPMTVRFTTGAGGGGSLVATASASVRVGSDGALLNLDRTPLSGVTNVTTIDTVEIAPDQTIPLLQTLPLTVNVLNAQGAVVAVPEGAIQLAVMTGDAALVSDGRVKGVAPGSVTMVATVDGVASQTTLVRVARKAAGVQQIKMGATALRYAPMVSRLYAGVGPTAYGYGQEVLAINPENAAVGSRVALEKSVERLAVAADGSLAYAVTDSYRTVRIVNLQTGALIGSIELSSDVSAVAVSPTDPTMLAVTSAADGLALYRNGVKLPAPVGVETVSGPVVFNSEGTMLYARRTSGVVQVSVTTSGVGTITGSSLAGNPVAVRGDRLFLSTGEIVGVPSLASMGQLTVDEGVTVAGLTASPSGARVFVLTGSSQLGSPAPTVLVYDAATREKVEEYAITIPTGPWFELTATGEHGVAFTSVLTPTSDPSVILASLNWP